MWENILISGVDCKVAIISLKKNLVYKVPLDITLIDSINNQYLVKLIALDDIEDDEWLKKDKKSCK